MKSAIVAAMVLVVGTAFANEPTTPAAAATTATEKVEGMAADVKAAGKEGMADAKAHGKEGMKKMEEAGKNMKKSVEKKKAGK
jgi:hypothetical protein